MNITSIAYHSSPHYPYYPPYPQTYSNSAQLPCYNFVPLTLLKPRFLFVQKSHYFSQAMTAFRILHLSFQICYFQLRDNKNNNWYMGSDPQTSSWKTDALSIRPRRRLLILKISTILVVLPCHLTCLVLVFFMCSMQRCRNRGQGPKGPPCLTGAEGTGADLGPFIGDASWGKIFFINRGPTVKWIGGPVDSTK